MILPDDPLRSAGSQVTLHKGCQLRGLFSEELSQLLVRWPRGTWKMWISRSWHEQNHGRTIKGILVLLASISLYVKLFFWVIVLYWRLPLHPCVNPMFLGTLPHTSPASPRSWHSLEYQVQNIKTPFSLREHVKTRSYPHCLTLFLLLKSPVSWYVCYSTG